MPALTSCRRQQRQDFRKFQALIATPGNLATGGVVLPSNADIYVSTSSLLAASTLLVDADARSLGAPAGAAAATHHIGWFERAVKFVKHSGAPGTVHIYIRNGLGHLFLIGQG